MPSLNNMHLSNYRKVSAEGVWMVATIVRPLLDSLFRSLAMEKAEIESRPEVGSSKRSNEGFVIISYPMEILLSSPFLTF